MNSKPRVQYDDVMPVSRGESARVLIRNQGWMRTTKVVALWKHPGGMPLFETQNTIYAPPETDESRPIASQRSRTK